MRAYKYFLCQAFHTILRETRAHISLFYKHCFSHWCFSCFVCSSLCWHKKKKKLTFLLMHRVAWVENCAPFFFFFFYVMIFACKFMHIFMHIHILVSLFPGSRFPSVNTVLIWLAVFRNDVNSNVTKTMSQKGYTIMPLTPTHTTQLATFKLHIYNV